MFLSRFKHENKHFPPFFGHKIPKIGVKMSIFQFVKSQKRPFSHFWQPSPPQKHNFPIPPFWGFSTPWGLTKWQMTGVKTITWWRALDRGTRGSRVWNTVKAKALCVRRRRDLFDKIKFLSLFYSGPTCKWTDCERTLFSTVSQPVNGQTANGHFFPQ